VCYAHEHVIIDPSFTTFCYPDFLLDSVDKAVVDVGEFRAAGGKTLVDSMPCGGGRSASKLAEVARRTGANILCPTGLHLAKYYAPGHWGERLAAEQLAALFLGEIDEGIDGLDLNGPTIQRTPYRAGLIKVATGESGFTPREEKIFEAAAAAHNASGAPILTHTEQGEWGLEQVEFLRSLGANLGRVVLSHTDRKPDPVYHKELLSMGIMLEYDSAFRWKMEEGNPTADLVVEMCASGYRGQILLGMDAARRGYWRAYGGKPGLAFLLEEFVPQLKSRGLSQSDVDTIFIENPARCYSFYNR
jgi:predicted metal-dependent phosphotriesterase family hydrolase